MNIYIEYFIKNVKFIFLSCLGLNCRIVGCFVGCSVYTLLAMLIINMILYDFIGEIGFECYTQCVFVDEVGVKCSTQCAYVRLSLSLNY